LEIGLQHPLLGQHLIGEVVHFLEEGQAGIVVMNRAEPVFLVKRQSIVRQLHQRPIHVEHLVESGPERIGLAALSPLARSHCPLPPARQDNGITAKAGSICRKSSSIATKSGKYEYLLKSTR
jgi:hypothetical protein